MTALILMLRGSKYSQIVNKSRPVNRAGKATSLSYHLLQEFYGALDIAASLLILIYHAAKRIKRLVTLGFEELVNVFEAGDCMRLTV